MNGFSPSLECPRCRELEHQLAVHQQQLAAQAEQLAALEARLKQLQKQLEQRTRAGQRQAAPFRRTKKKPPDEQGRPGRPPAERPPPEKLDRTLLAAAELCPDCRVALVDKTVHVQSQTDLPPVQPVVTQFQVEVGRCPCCGTAYLADARRIAAG